MADEKAIKDPVRGNWDGSVDEKSGFPTNFKADPAGSWVLFTKSVKDGDKTVPLEYAVPHFDAFLAYVQGLPKTLPEGQKGMSQETIYDRFLYATDLKARAAQRESVAAESTVIMVNGKPVDLMTLEPAKAVASINAAFMWAATTGKEPQKAAQVARRKMLADGIAGKGVVEDATTKMLSLKK